MIAYSGAVAKTGSLAQQGGQVSQLLVSSFHEYLNLPSLLTLSQSRQRNSSNACMMFSECAVCEQHVSVRRAYFGRSGRYRPSGPAGWADIAAADAKACILQASFMQDWLIEVYVCEQQGRTG